MSRHVAHQSNRSTPTWALAAASAAWLAYLLAISLAWQTARAASADGATYDETPGPDGLLVLDVPADSSAHAAGLQPGDHIVAVDNVPFTSTGEFFNTLNQLRPDGTYTYSVRPARANDRASLEELTVRPRPLLEDQFTVTMFGVFTIAGALTLLIATFVLLVRPALEAARVLFVIGVGGAVMLAMAVWGDSGFFPAAIWAHYLLSGATAAALLHLFLVLPARHPWLAYISPAHWSTRSRSVVGLLLLYGLSQAAVVCLGLTASAFGRIYVLDAAIIGIGLVLLIGAYRHPALPPLARAQLRWIVWAFVLLVLTLVAAVVVPVVLFGQYPFVSVGIVTLVWCAFPLSIAFAVLRYRLFDVDAVLRATFVYGVLATALVVAYVGSAFVLGRLVASLAGPIAGADPTVALVAALGVAALAHPLRLRVQDGLDRLVYRHNVARRRFGLEASEWLARARPLEGVANLLTHQAPARLGLVGGGLVLASGMERLHAPFSTLPGPLPAAPRVLADRLAGFGGPAIVANGEQWSGDIPVLSPDDPAVEPWYAAGARVLVPLGSGQNDSGAGQHLVGVWALGDRASGDVLDREDLRTLDRIGQQAAVLLDYLRLGREQAQQEVVRRELERARAIQQHLLPETLPAWPGKLDLAARLRPAFETSGDFYDVFCVRSADAPETVQLVVADVAGKGIGAALVMALARATLRASSDVPNDASASTTVRSPAAILGRAGALLHADVGISNFVACTLAVFERRSSGPRLRLANAGQVFPLLYRHGEILELDPGGNRLPLGVAERPAYDELTVELVSGDVLVFVTDGLPEAPHHGQHRGEVFGFERLAACAAHLAESTTSAAEVVEGLWNEMTSWISGEAEHDDVTLVVARVPSERSARG